MTAEVSREGRWSIQAHELSEFYACIGQTSESPHAGFEAELYAFRHKQGFTKRKIAEERIKREKKKS
jgi:hypothetical protein